MAVCFCEAVRVILADLHRDVYISWFHPNFFCLYACPARQLTNFLLAPTNLPLRQQFPPRNRQPSQQQQLERCFLQFTETSRNKAFTVVLRLSHCHSSSPFRFLFSFLISRHLVAFVIIFRDGAPQSSRCCRER